MSMQMLERTQAHGRVLGCSFLGPFLPLKCVWCPVPRPWWCRDTWDQVPNWTERDTEPWQTLYNQGGEDLEKDLFRYKAQEVWSLLTEECVAPNGTCAQTRTSHKKGGNNMRSQEASRSQTVDVFRAKEKKTRNGKTEEHKPVSYGKC